VLINVMDLYKYYHHGDSITKALDGLSLQVKKGEMLAIMGRSGSGKSTLLNILAGIDYVDKGKYYYDNKKVPLNNQKELSIFRRDKIGFIVQNFALIGYKNTFDNVALPLKYQKYTKKEINSKVMALLKSVSLKDKANKYPHELSGGECQRVAIARALINDPELILADEPTGSLDIKTEEEIMDIFAYLNQELGKTIIIVTHNFDIAKKCTRVIHIHEGKITA